jgi:hypothetical protein
VAAGFQFSPSQGGIHPYFLTGYGSAQAVANANFGPGQRITPGITCAASGSALFAGTQAGFSDYNLNENINENLHHVKPFGEIGITTDPTFAVAILCGRVE